MEHEKSNPAGCRQNLAITRCENLRHTATITFVLSALPMLMTVTLKLYESANPVVPGGRKMLAKFDPVGDRNYWLKYFLDYLRTSDPERVSPSVRPHYAQSQT